MQSSSSSSMRPENFPEQVVWYTIIGTFGLYYLGAQFVWIPLMAWGLTAYLIWQWWQEPLQTPDSRKIMITSPVWIWITAMIGIEAALVIGHANFELGLGLMAKSTLNRWFRQWALLALFPLLGTLNIRPQLVIRAICILCLQSLGVCCLASLVILGLHQPEISFLSPLNAFGGGEIFYKVHLFGSVLDNGELRMQLFAPWPPALGLMGNLFFWCALQERHRLWRWVGLIGSTTMVIGSFSRLGILVLPLVGGLLFLLKRVLSASLLLGIGSLSLLGGLFASQILNTLETVKNRFTQARSGSSKTRSLLQELALDQWWNEAPIWGHGTIAPKGPRVVGFMPIGTHHQWFGTLYSHGAVGCALLAIAFLWSFGILLMRFWRSALARLGLALWFVFFVFSWGENLEVLAYLIWPALLLMGIAYRNLEELA